MANKHDEGKTRYDCIPPGALREVARAMASGVDKYGEDNWLADGGLSRRQLYAATMRHLEAHRGGERDATDTGINHLAHAAASILMLLHFDQQNRPVEPGLIRLYANGHDVQNG